ncbi:MAG: carbohydrate-binding family 9-like protein [Victivallales bacterium]|nr:carbohydrate-binding family 9-like protein [Victivallales bacterium]
MSLVYNVGRAPSAPRLDAGWDSGDWEAAEIMDISVVRPESSSHHPCVKLKLLYDSNSIYGLFKVEDRYVRSVRKGYQKSVCKDSCVEFFFSPLTDGGYFNLECNCGGTVLCYYIRDNSPPPPDAPAQNPPRGFKDCTPLSEEDIARINIHHSMPEIVEPEITDHVMWYLGFEFPFDVVRKYAGNFTPVENKKWKANAYKCADDTSHPHWLSWAPLEKKRFHAPESFGTIAFEDNLKKKSKNLHSRT